MRKSKSPFSSPAFPIRKRNGKIRLVVDYRDLNKNTLPIIQLFPMVHDCLLTLKGSKVFSQIDLNSGYYQISLDRNSIKYTAFSLGDSHYEFLRMPFGLTNAPMTFRKCMNDLFNGINYVKTYLDDILIHSKNDEEHLRHLENILDILNRNKISVNFEKADL
ncbi:Transposon Ty3-G Gag-Pol polyprotein [Dictyocoela muelleri]|nr:Transposon Ty3-G Gag-Pol polyprotein [Dictyocoela muelleri]